MKYLYWMIVVVVLNHCGSANTNKPAEVMPYVNTFASMYPQTPVNDIEMQFVDALDTPVTLAICQVSPDLMTPRKILIVKNSWDNRDTFGKLWIIFHELGHCSLSREHTTRLYGDGCPKSFMYPSFSPETESCFNAHQDEMFQELGDPNATKF